VQSADFGSKLHAQLGVEVKQRFIEQEDFWLAGHRPPHGDALPLPAGKSGGIALQVSAKAQEVGPTDCRLALVLA
jgi:hypothetical protein